MIENEGKISLFFLYTFFLKNINEIYSSYFVLRINIDFEFETIWRFINNGKLLCKLNYLFFFSYI